MSALLLEGEKGLLRPEYFGTNLNARCILGLLQEFAAYSINSVSVNKVAVLCNLFVGMALFKDEIYHRIIEC